MRSVPVSTNPAPTIRRSSRTPDSNIDTAPHPRRALHRALAHFATLPKFSCRRYARDALEQRLLLTRDSFVAEHSKCPGAEGPRLGGLFLCNLALQFERAVGKH